MKQLLLAGLLISGTVAESTAWSSNGHMIIAAMAYRALPINLQEEYTMLLHHHPDFKKWEQSYAELDVAISFGEYLFMQASIWPDVIRRKGNPYDHPTWHYTNFPVIPDGFAVEETLTPENDVIFAIRASRQMLVDENATNQDRAAHLSWLLHTIGDMHQPLHCVALVTDVYPEGDRGGNLFFVRPTERSRGVNLHAYWDGLLGRNGKIRDARNDATELWLTEKNQVAGRLGDAEEIRDWALEGREIAIEYVYLGGRLEGEVEERRGRAPILPATYGNRAKSIAQERAILASLRIVGMLSANQ